MIKDTSARKGRRHRSRQEADQLAAEYEVSGLSRVEFCRRKQVAMKTLARYVARYRKQRQSAGERAKARWVAVELGGQRGDGGGKTRIEAARAKSTRFGAIRGLVEGLREEAYPCRDREGAGW